MTFWQNKTSATPNPALAVLNEALLPDVRHMVDEGGKHHGIDRVGYRIPAEYVKAHVSEIAQALASLGIENLGCYDHEHEMHDLHLPGSDAKILADAGAVFLGSDRLKSLRRDQEIQDFRQDLVLFSIPAQSSHPMPYQGREIHAFRVSEKDKLPLLQFINRHIRPSLDATGMSGDYIGFKHSVDAERLYGCIQKAHRLLGRKPDQIRAGFF